MPKDFLLSSSVKVFIDCPARFGYVLLSMVNYDLTKLKTNPQYMQVTSYGFATKLISFLCLFAFGESRFPPFALQFYNQAHLMIKSRKMGFNMNFYLDLSFWTLSHTLCSTFP